MKRRWPLSPALALVLASAAAACGNGTTSVADGKEQAMRARRTVAAEYWRVYDSLGKTVERSNGSGAFAKCPDDTGNSAAYTIEDTVDAKDLSVTLQQFRSDLEANLKRVGWTLRSAGVKSGVGFYTGQREDLNMTLRLQDRTKTVEAGGFLAVRGGCADLGSAQEEILRDYSGDSRDTYRASPASPSPIPTTFPDPDKLP